MSGSNSSAPGSDATREAAAPLSFTVHSMPAPGVEDLGRRTTMGRVKMLLILLFCASPVIASYFTYFVVRPEGRTNYGELIDPQRPLPQALALTDLQGQPRPAASLRGQWLLLVVSGGACDAGCEKRLWLQRQLRETLGREKERVDKVWLIVDGQPVRPETLRAVEAIAPPTVLRVPREALSEWLQPAPGRSLEEHLYIVDPIGNWMMRVPADPEPAKLKRDLEKLLRASSSWDTAGRP